MTRSAYPPRSLNAWAAGLFLLSCTSAPGPSAPPSIPGGTSGSAGSQPGAGPGSGPAVSPGGTGGNAGSPPTASSGGSAPDAGSPETGTAGSADPRPSADSGGAPDADSPGSGDAPVLPPADGPESSLDAPASPPPAPDAAGPGAALCDYTIKPSALSRTLGFQRINLTGLTPAQGMSEAEGYLGGITELKFLPGTSNEFFLARKGGQVLHYRLEGSNASLLASLSLGAEVTSRQDCGLISMDFDPDFVRNRFVFFGHCTGAAGRASKISRFTYRATGQLTGRVDTFNVVAPAPGESWHSIGSMGFDRDKNLWVIHGEFNTGDPAQDASSPLGKLHRIVPNRDPLGNRSTPAPGNPEGRSFIARGLRSPWRGAYHPGKGWYLIAEVAPGQTDWEEINIVTQLGANLGWPGGTCNAGSIACWAGALQTMKLEDSANLPEDNATRTGRSAWVGPPYGDCGNDRYAGSLTGTILAGDFFKGWVIGLVLDDKGAKLRDVNLVDPPGFTMISSVTQGPDGYFYVTKFGNYHQGAQDDTTQGLYRVLLEP